MISALFSPTIKSLQYIGDGQQGKMMNTKIYRILVLLTTVMSILGCVIFSQFPRVLFLENNTTLTINENETTSLKVDLSDIYPGNSAEYTINLYTSVKNGLNISVSFDGDSNKGDLDKYLNVSFSSESVSINKSLHDVLTSKETFDMGQDIKHISIVYTMPSSIGNEAQNSFADFYINLNANRS